VSEQDRPVASTPAADAPALEVFWRPGCPYCSTLRRQLERRGVPAAWRNIWDDEHARAFVASVNAGNETVPTVRVGPMTLTNPSWRQLATVLPEGPWQDDPPGGVFAHAWRRALSWLPVLVAVAASLTLDAFGHSGASWAADAVAAAAWLLTRPLRR
jgi:mycoredoxin